MATLPEAYKLFLIVVMSQTFAILVLYNYKACSKTWLMRNPTFTCRAITDVHRFWRKLTVFASFQINGTNNDNKSMPSEEQCQEYPWQHPNDTFILKEDYKSYFFEINGTRCLNEGTNVSLSSNSCHCLHGWHGNHCSIPDVVHYSDLPKKFFPEICSHPRRIIHAFPFNMEFNIFEARIHELGDIIDVFLILESNFTAYGDPKPTLLLNRLKAGYYPEVACKIVHVYLDYFPEEAHKNGWIEDALLRNYLGTQGLANQLDGVRHNDILLLTDADELPGHDTVLFLKLHTGYPEPFQMVYSWRIYGFFWTPEYKNTRIIPIGMTIGMLVHVLDRKAYRIRSGLGVIQKYQHKLNHYLKTGALVHLWNLGNKTHPAGFHCSWCCNPACIQNKLISAQNGDFPRWGDYVEKTKLAYIKRLIKTGTWFDNKSHMKHVPMYERNYAPKYLLQYYDSYKDILINPYVNSTTLDHKSTTSSQINRPSLKKTGKGN